MYDYGFLEYANIFILNPDRTGLHYTTEDKANFKMW